MRIEVVIGVFAILFGSVACSSVETNEHITTKKVVREMFEAFNKHDVAKLVSLYAEDAVVVSPDKCEPLVGRPAIAADYQGLFDQVPDVKDTISVMIVEGQQVAVGFTASSEIEGAAFQLPIAAILTVQDGLIVRDVGYFDSDIEKHCE